MHVTVSTTFPAAIRGEIEALVRSGFDGVEHDDVEVHVRARGRVRRTYVARYEGPLRRIERDLRRRGRELVRDDGSRHPRPGPDDLVRVHEPHRRRRDAEEVARRHGGRVEVATSRHPRAGSWSARAYDGVPAMGRVRPGARYLVTMTIPADPRRLTRYPVEDRDPRLKTSPVVRFTSWRDQLVHLAAHEARHIHQYRHGLSRSEKDAEVWAADRLDAWRAALTPEVLARDGAAPREIVDAATAATAPPEYAPAASALPPAASGEPAPVEAAPAASARDADPTLPLDWP